MKRRLLFLLTVFLLFVLAQSCTKDKATPDLTTVTDIDGNVYNTVTIGTQTWMAENLRTTRFNDGTTIPLITDNDLWAVSNTPAFCWYENDQAVYGNTYGALYNWYAVNSGALCPTGWHIPTIGEWTTLFEYLGGPSVAGGKLKETGTSHWYSPNTGATNETGFTALPGGYRYSGTFNRVGDDGCWWNATENSTTYAWFRYISYDGSDVLSGYKDKAIGFSVRCVKD